ncbi:MAG: hypothetical protein ACHQUC_03395 [Chlamydiales bacterium]
MIPSLQPSLLDFLEDIKNIQAGTYSVPPPPQDENSDTDIADLEGSDDQILIAIQEYSDPSPPSQKHNVSAEIERNSPIANDEIEKKLIRLRQTPRQLYEVSKKYLFEEDLRVKALALKYLKEAVDAPINKWDPGRQIHLEARIAKSEAATHVARGYHTGVGLEQDDDCAKHYYKLAKGKLIPDDKTAIVGTNCFEAASFLSKIAEERKEPDLFLKSIKWFKQSLSAKYFPSQRGLPEIAANFWLLSRIDPCKIQYNLKSYEYCFRALNINQSISGERAIARTLKGIKTETLDPSRSHALVTLGHLYHHGYYESEKGYELTNSSLSLICYKKAFEAGHLDIILEAMEACKFIQGPPAELEMVKREAQTLLSALTEMRDHAAPEETRQKLDALLKTAEEKFNAKWETHAEASSSSDPFPKRQRRI